MAKQMLASKKGIAEGRNPSKCKTINSPMPRKGIVKKERSGPIGK